MKIRTIPGVMLLLLSVQLGVSGAQAANNVNCNKHCIKSRIKALETMVANQMALINTLQAQVAVIPTLQGDLIAAQIQIEQLETNTANVAALNSYLTVDEIDHKATLSGINLQIVNGEGQTASINGLGNLIVGYDEIAPNLDGGTCSDGAYAQDIDGCISNGHIWSQSHKTGSHYLVLGTQNNYSQYGGFVAGVKNYATGPYSTVTAGFRNIASGTRSSVSGGWTNTASGVYSSVSGGGRNNRASGGFSSVIGGQFNTASGGNSSVSGGIHNTASGPYSSVSGGKDNTASGPYSSVSGGSNRSAPANYNWAAGDLLQDF